jgi:hypothetical protein
MSERNSANIGRFVICILIVLTVGVMITPVVASEWTTPTPLLSEGVFGKYQYHMVVSDTGEKNIIYGIYVSTQNPYSENTKIIYLDDAGVEKELASATSPYVNDQLTGHYLNYPDITIDGFGNLHVIYEDTDRDSGSVRSLMYTSRIQGIWTTPTPLLSEGVFGKYEYHMVVSDTGEKNIIYVNIVSTENPTTENTKIIYVDDAGVEKELASATSQYVNDQWTGHYLNYPDITIDGFGNLHVIYEDTDRDSGSVRSLMYTSRIQGMWTSPTPLLSEGVFGKHQYHMVVSDTGEKNIIYGIYVSTENPTTENTKIIYVDDAGVEKELASATSPYVNDQFTGHFLYYPDITIDGFGNLHVIYEDTDRGSGSVRSLMYTKKLASSFDWRKYKGKDWMTPVRSQGLWGACWAFATIGSVEAKFNIEQGSQQDIDLSEWDVHYQIKHGKDEGGWPVEAYNVLRTSGIVDESCNPFNWDDPVLHVQQPNIPWGRCSDASLHKWVINEQKSLDSASQMEIKQKIMEEGPITIVVPWGSGLHAVVLVGWNDHDGVWIIKNSWDKTWGDHGYGTIPYTGSEKSDIQTMDWSISVHGVGGS